MNSAKELLFFITVFFYLFAMVSVMTPQQLCIKTYAKIIKYLTLNFQKTKSFLANQIQRLFSGISPDVLLRPLRADVYTILQLGITVLEFNLALISFDPVLGFATTLSWDDLMRNSGEKTRRDIQVEFPLSRHARLAQIRLTTPYRLACRPSIKQTVEYLMCLSIFFPTTAKMNLHVDY